jgi:hypothetical protein
MSVMKSLFRNVNVLNVLLSGAVVVLAYFMVIPFLNPDIRVAIPRPAKTAAPLGIQTAVMASPSPVDYALVSDQNLFHPERKIPPEKAEEKAVPRPEVILYGTLITSDLSVAYIEDKKAPRTTPGRGKRQIALQKGEDVGGYILNQIEADRIVLVKGDDRLVIKLEEGEKRKDGETAKAPAVSGMSPVGPQPSSPAASPRGTASARVSPVAASPLPATIPLETANTTGGPGAGPGSRRGMAQEIQRIKQDRLKQTQ